MMGVEYGLLTAQGIAVTPEVEAMLRKILPATKSAIRREWRRRPGLILRLLADFPLTQHEREFFTGAAELYMPQAAIIA